MGRIKTLHYNLCPYCGEPTLKAYMRGKVLWTECPNCGVWKLYERDANVEVINELITQEDIDQLRKDLEELENQKEKEGHGRTESSSRTTDKSEDRPADTELVGEPGSPRNEEIDERVHRFFRTGSLE